MCVCVWVCVCERKITESGGGGKGVGCILKGMEEGVEIITVYVSDLYDMKFFFGFWCVFYSRLNPVGFKGIIQRLYCSCCYAGRVLKNLLYRRRLEIWTYRKTQLWLRNASIIWQENWNDLGLHLKQISLKLVKATFCFKARSLFLGGGGGRGGGKKDNSS